MANGKPIKIKIKSIIILMVIAFTLFSSSFMISGVNANENVENNSDTLIDNSLVDEFEQEENNNEENTSQIDTPSSSNNNKKQIFHNGVEAIRYAEEYLDSQENLKIKTTGKLKLTANLGALGNAAATLSLDMVSVRKGGVSYDCIELNITELNIANVVNQNTLSSFGINPKVLIGSMYCEDGVYYQSGLIDKFSSGKSLNIKYATNNSYNLALSRKALKQEFIYDNKNCDYTFEEIIKNGYYKKFDINISNKSPNYGVLSNNVGGVLSSLEIYDPVVINSMKLTPYISQYGVMKNMKYSVAATISIDTTYLKSAFPALKAVLSMDSIVASVNLDYLETYTIISDSYVLDTTKQINFKNFFYSTIEIKDGTWWINGNNTLKSAIDSNGNILPSKIYEKNNYWYINEDKTDVKA